MSELRAFAPGVNGLWWRTCPGALAPGVCSRLASEGEIPRDVERPGAAMPPRGAPRLFSTNSYRVSFSMSRKKSG